MRTATRFFFSNAGWSYDPKVETAQKGRWRCARELAAAEEYGVRHGFAFEWRGDDDADLSWMSEAERAEPHDVEGCVVRDARGAVMGSLWGIVDANAAYRRVVEAELAEEAMREIEKSFEEV